MGWYFAQSIWLFSRSCRSILLTGGCWSISAFSALSLQLLVVLTMMRSEKAFFPDAVKKLSMSLFVGGMSAHTACIEWREIRPCQRFLPPSRYRHRSWVSPEVLPIGHTSIRRCTGLCTWLRCVGSRRSILRSMYPFRAPRPMRHGTHRG